MAEQPTPGENPTEPVVAAPPAPAVPAAIDPPVEVKPAPVAAPVVAESVKPPLPEKYEIKDVHPGLIEAMTPIFRKNGITGEGAQEMAAAVAAFNKTLPAQIMARDLETLKADKELGGMNLVRTQGRVNDALAAFTTPQERAELAALGLANNPTLVRMWHRVGASMQEAPQTDAGPQPRAPVSRASKLYGGRDLKPNGPPPKPN